MRRSRTTGRHAPQRQSVLIHDTAIGTVGMAEADGRITRLFLPGEARPAGRRRATPCLCEAFAQLEAYLNVKRNGFSLELAPDGTPFMRQVWALVCAVPYGNTASYGEIARGLGTPGASRAVGNATHANPIPIFIPCHRIIGADRTLVGYGGGLALKARLLGLEQAEWVRKGGGV